MDMYEAAMTVANGGEPERERAALQALINSGAAWTLEGAVGRAAMAAIEAGRCALGPESMHDFWGNRVPARTEVVPGTKGSVEFVEAHGVTVAD